MKKEQKSAIEQEAIELLALEKAEWENATCFVTDKISFDMRKIIETCRRNYWGIFNQPVDPTTGKEKTFVPLTESYVDNVIKNIDLDTKDINFRAKKAESIGLTAIIRSAVKKYLDDIDFGEILDESERDLAIDGTIVWKTFEEDDEEGEKELCIDKVNLLNFYIDPTAKSIRNQCRFGGVMERFLMSPDKVKSFKADGWINTEEVVGQLGLNINDPFMRTLGAGANVKLVELFERWGMFSKFLMTGKEEDRDKNVFGRIVASNVGGQGSRVHVIETRKFKELPYEECRYSKVTGRWYGRGIAEKLLMLQIWLNTIVNIRINRAAVAQLGLWKSRIGSGVTPQQMSRLMANGVIPLRDLQDLEQIPMQEASQSSYQDEEVIKSWSQQTTSIYEAASGEAGPASQPATNAVIQSRAAQSQFTFVKKGVGLFLQRWIKHHVLPFISKSLTADEVVRLTGEVEELRDIDERIANQLLHEKLEEMNKKGQFFNIERVETERQRLIETMSKRGSDRYFKLKEDINPGDYDTQVYITNEEIDKGVLAQNLVTVLQTIPNLPNSGIDPLSVARMIFDVMGVDSSQMRTNKLQTAPAPQPQMPQGMAPTTGAPVQSDAEAVTKANV